MIDDTLFAPQKNISILDIKDGLEERFTQVDALLSYLLTDTSHPEPIEPLETLFGALWVVERLVNEIKFLDNQLFEQVLTKTNIKL